MDMMPPTFGRGSVTCIVSRVWISNATLGCSDLQSGGGKVGASVP